MKTVKIKIKNQKVNVNFEGFNGKSCDLEEEKIFGTLRKETVERENKPEYYEEQEGQELNKEGW